MKRLLAGIVALAAMIAIPSPVAASLGCSYDPTTHRMTVSIGGPNSYDLTRNTIGQILIDGSGCGATVTNTDLIVVNGDAGSQGIGIDLNNGGFSPGFTDEPGTSDEIEFAIKLGGGNADEVTIIGTDNVDRIDLGQTATARGVVQRINLNSGETTGIDWDVAMIGVEKVTVKGNKGADVIRARGQADSGPNPFGLPLVIRGGSGDDIIKGGDAGDQLWGDAGKDQIWGYGGADTIRMDDGTGGDVGYGGTGADTVMKDAGDTWHTN
jgi:RTX calcium-binding nonapeptide repeat (4 copies)